MANEQSNLLNIGDHFGNYVVERLLGTGGMGMVYLVRASNGKRYALKVMRPEDGDTREVRKRFRREAEFAMNIRHGNLISVHAAGEDEKTGLCYLVMDYMPGGSLADLIRKNGALPIKDAISIATRIAEALDVAHLNGVIHRDVKPDNILFSAKGVPMLADLGVAKFDDNRTNLTTTGMVIGTPAYMAPEQMLDSRHVDGRADIYALGIVLYQMLAGRRPNENDTAVELMAKAIKGEPLPDVRTLRPEVSAAVAYILSLMCAPKPEDRPTTLRDVVRLFRDASFGRLVVPEKPTAEAKPADVSSPSDVKRGLAVWMIVSLVVVLGLVVAGMWMWTDVRQRERAQESPLVVTNVIEHVVPSKNVTATNLPAHGNDVNRPSVSTADAYGECDFSMLGEQAEKYVQMPGRTLWARALPFLGDGNRRESPPDSFTARNRIDLTKPMVFCDALNMMGVPPHVSTNVVMLLGLHERFRDIPLGSLLNALPNIRSKIRPLLDGHASLSEIMAAVQEELDVFLAKDLGKTLRQTSSLERSSSDPSEHSSSEVESAGQMSLEMMQEEIAPGFLELFESGTSAATTAEATATATVNVQVQVPLPKPPPPPEPVFEKLRVCVLDFTTIDINGQIRFLSGTNQKIDVPPQCTLNDADRKSINDVMQGFVRLVDAWDNARTDEANREAQVDDNVFRRTKALDIWNTTVRGQSRPMVIGAEYLESYLGRHSDVFACLDRGLMAAEMGRLRNDPDFPTDYQLKLARASGATHLIYGTVGDLSSRENSFSGYGISTKTTTYSLDVIVKVVDLVAQQTVHANTYTGTYRQQRPISGAQFDNNIFQSLMKSALEQAAKDLYDMCKPGRHTKIRVTPLPEKRNLGGPIGIAEPEIGSQFSKDDALAIWDELEASFHSKEYTLISRSALKQIMAEIGLSTSSDLLNMNETQKARLSQFKGVKYLIVPSLRKLGTRITLALKMVDASTGEVDQERTATLKATSLDEIADKLESALDDMLRNDKNGTTVAKSSKKCALLTPIIKMAQAPSYLQGDFNTWMQSALLSKGIQLANLADVSRFQSAGLTEMTDQDYAVLGRKLCVACLIQFEITDFAIIDVPWASPETGASGHTYSGRFRARMKVVDANDGTLVDACPVFFDSFLGKTINGMPPSPVETWAEQMITKPILEQIVPRLEQVLQGLKRK